MSAKQEKPKALKDSEESLVCRDSTGRVVMILEWVETSEWLKVCADPEKVIVSPE